MCDTGQETNSNQENDDYDCNSLPTMGMDIHTVSSFNDFKYYFLTLGFTILTMLILKVVWKLTKIVTKCLSITIVQTADDLSENFFKKVRIKSNTNTGIIVPRVDSFQSNKLDAILYRNGNSMNTKVRRSQSSTTSLRSISLSNDNDGNDIDTTLNNSNNINIVRTDSEMSRIEKGSGTVSPPPITNERKIHAFGFVFTYHKDL